MSVDHLSHNLHVRQCSRPLEGRDDIAADLVDAEGGDAILVLVDDLARLIHGRQATV